MGVRNKMRKLLSLMLVFLVVFSALPMVAKAQTSSLSFDEIEVEGTTVVLNNDVVDVAVVKDLTENSETFLPIRIRLKSTQNIEDLKVSAWIGGYEFGVPRDTSEPFDITTYGTGAVKSVVLKLPLPKDLESSKVYKLNVEAFNNDMSLKKEIKLNVEGKRHLVDLFDVIVNPSLSVDAGTPVIVKARVENLGDRTEDDVKFTLAVTLTSSSVLSPRFSTLALTITGVPASTLRLGFTITSNKSTKCLFPSTLSLISFFKLMSLLKASTFNLYTFEDSKSLGNGNFNTTDLTAPVPYVVMSNGSDVSRGTPSSYPPIHADTFKSSIFCVDFNLILIGKKVSEFSVKSFTTATSTTSLFKTTVVPSTSISSKDRLFVCALATMGSALNTTKNTNIKLSNFLILFLTPIYGL